MNIWLWVSLVIILVLGGAIISHLVMRKHIKKVLEDNHCQAISISWAIFSVETFLENSNTVFNVTYQTPSGEIISTRCKANFNGIYWLDKSPDSYKYQNPLNL
jgi:hypothetical protein